MNSHFVTTIPVFSAEVLKLQLLGSVPVCGMHSELGETV